MYRHCKNGRMILMMTCILFAVAIAASLVALIAGNRAEASAKTPEFDRFALELVIGETDRLELKNASGTVGWTSSDSGIVEVDGEGNVKGVSKGIADVTASCGGNEYKCRIYVVEKEYSFDDDIMISIFWPPTRKYITDEQYKYMADAGITWVMSSGDNLGAKSIQLKMLDLCYKYGIHMTVADDRLGANLLNLKPDAIKKIVNEYRNIPGANGYYMLDEPLNPNVFLNAYRALKEADPASYMHLNFLPYGAYSSIETYKAQMNDWLKLCAGTGYKQDYLMYDLYPFGLEKNSMNRTGFLLNLNAVREIGLKNGVKTGTYIQSVEQSVAFRSPNEAETRYEINMALAFGVKQLSYFTWFTPYNRSEPFDDGIISYEGVPNPKYEFICRLNGEVKNVGPVLAKCDSLEVYQGSNKYGAMELIPDDFFVHTKGKADVTAAYLRNRENGRNYLMVVNNNFTKKKSFTLIFESGIRSLEYLSEKDGKIYSQEMDGGDNSVSVELEAGAARIFVLPEGFDFSERREWKPAAGENLALRAEISCDSSIGSGGWYMSALNDGERFSTGDVNGWRTAEGTGTGVIVADFGREVEFNRIDLYPAGNRFSYGTAFPSEFTISVSRDGEQWYKLAYAKDFAVKGTAVPSVKTSVISARYVRIVISGMKDGAAELCEIEIYNDDGTLPGPETIVESEASPRGKDVVKYSAGKNIARGRKVTVSSYPTDTSYRVWGWWPEFLVDGDPAKGWTSNVKIHMDSGDCTEFAVIDLGDVFAVSRIEVTPLGCWPRAFEILVSRDQIEWTAVASETNSSEPDGKYVAEPSGKPAGRYLMFKATKLRNTSADGYMLQLGDIAVYGSPVKDSGEAEELMALFISSGGDPESAGYKEAGRLLADPDATQSQLDRAMKAMLSEVGKELPENGAGTGETVKYDIETVENPMSEIDDTEVPTPGAPSEPPAGNGAGKNRGSVIAGTVAAGLAIAAAATVAAVIIIRKKRGR